MLKLENITKIFPGVIALSEVSVQFERGSVHALMGENGAGKSTLMKIITGIYQPDYGKMILDGEIVKIRNFHEAIKKEINIVNQEIQIIPEFSIAENICIDKMNNFKKNGIIDWSKVNKFAQEYLEIVGLDLLPTDLTGGLTAAQKQLIQIAKAISSNAKYILMDEPTSSLTIHEIENLFKVINKLKSQNVGVIFVSHKIEEVIHICDKVSVLRDGKYIGTLDKAQMSKDEIVRMMIGRDGVGCYLGKLDIKNDNALEVKGLTTYGQFEKVSFSLKKGEILGFYGLVGSGRTELVRQIIGAEKFDEGEVIVNGKVAKIINIRDTLMKYKIGYVTENRKEEGLILDDNVSNNIALTVLNRFRGKMKKINYKKQDEAVQDMINRLKIKTPSSRTVVKTLSGGNQQKVSIAKWLAAECDILIIDEPTVGVDVGAKEYIHNIIWNLAKVEGKSIILISSDMVEIASLARRILVFKDYAINGEITDLNESECSYEHVSSQIGKYLA